MTKKIQDSNEDKLSLNDAFKRLEQITAKIEDDTIDLEESIPLLKDGLELAKLIKSRLTKIENEIEEVKGKYGTRELKMDLDEDDTTETLGF